MGPVPSSGGLSNRAAGKAVSIGNATPPSQRDRADMAEARFRPVRRILPGQGWRRFDSRLGFDVRRVKVQQAIAECGPGVIMTLRTFPPMPGSVVRHRIINALGIRQADLANAMGVSKVRISQILNGHAPITPEMALRLGNVTRTAPEYWLSLQRDFDLFQARRRLADQLDRLPKLVSEQDAKALDQ